MTGPKVPSGPNMMDLICYCGHQADIEEFTRGQPRLHYHCPVCHKHWHIEIPKPVLSEFQKPAVVVFDLL